MSYIGGVTLLIGQVQSGKSTLVDKLVNEYRGSNINVKIYDEIYTPVSDSAQVETMKLLKECKTARHTKTRIIIVCQHEKDIHKDIRRQADYIIKHQGAATLKYSFEIYNVKTKKCGYVQSLD